MCEFCGQPGSTCVVCGVTAPVVVDLADVRAAKERALDLAYGGRPFDPALDDLPGCGPDESPPDDEFPGWEDSDQAD